MLKTVQTIFSDAMINIKHLVLNRNKIDEKSYKNTLTYYISYEIANIVKPLFNQINGYIKESNGNKYLTLVATDENKDTRKSMKNYRTKSEILLAQSLKTQTIKIKNI